MTRAAMLLAAALVGAGVVYLIGRRPKDQETGEEDLAPQSTDADAPGLTGVGSARPPDASPTLAAGLGPQAALPAAAPPPQTGLSLAPWLRLGAGPTRPGVGPTNPLTPGGATLDPLKAGGPLW